jgi:hypothetical protein
MWAPEPVFAVPQRLKSETAKRRQWQALMPGNNVFSSVAPFVV